MVRRQIVEARSSSARKQRRQELGSLRSLVIRPATVTRYQNAFKAFIDYLHSQNSSVSRSLTGLDSQLQEYLEFLWEEGESLSLAGDTLSSVQHFQPSSKRNINGAWKLLKAWQMHELPARAPPFTWDTLRVLMAWFHGFCPNLALALYLGFKGLLRTGELLNVQAKDLILSPQADTGILHLGLTKTAALNPGSGHITIHDRTLLHLLRLWKTVASPDQFLVPWSPSKFRLEFSKALDATGLGSYQYKPYSLRRGGATALWLDTHNYSQVAYHGRWAAEKTLKIYIQDSLSLLTDIGFKPTQLQRQLMNQWDAVSRVEPSNRARKGRGRGRRV